MNSITANWRERVLEAAGTNRPLCIIGGGSKEFYGQLPSGEPLYTRAYQGVVDYEPTELVITARCGTPLTEVEAVLKEQGQALPWEPPRFGGATVGGAIASGLCGPGRAYVGSARDFVLGVTVLDGNGEILRFGGQVMKNVAGYDLPRLMAGSLGTLGLLLEVSLKVLPEPVSVTTLRVTVSQTRAIELINRWGGQPLPMSATCWHNGILTVRLSGARTAIQAAQELLGGDVMPPQEANAFWDSLREQDHPIFTGGPQLWRLSVSSTTPPLNLPGEPLVEWGGALRWYRGNLDSVSVRALAADSGGHATLYRSDKASKAIGVFHPLPKSLQAVHRSVKSALDPHRVFNPGRMYPDI